MMDNQKNYIILPIIREQRQLAKFYSLADCFVICSERENFPTTCVEAQCCGTPVVGFDTGGTKETSVLKEKHFVQYGDISSLSEQVKKALLCDSSEISRLAIEKFSTNTMISEYMKLYDQNGRKERVLLIDVNCKHSSTGNIVYSLFRFLNSSGREASVCFGRGEKINEKNIFKFGIDIETYIHAALSRITGYNGYFSLASTMRLIRYIDRFKPDLIHIHELHAYFVNIDILLTYLKKKKIPVVWTFHCEYMYTGKCGHAYECEKYKTECGECPSIHDYPKSLFFDKTKQMYAMKKKLLDDFDFTIVTPSEWLKQRVQTSFLKNKAVVVIHNGIDTDIFKPQVVDEMKNELNIPTDRKIVLAVAPDIMSKNKGGRWVIELAKKMENEFFFILIGEKRRK